MKTLSFAFTVAIIGITLSLASCRDIIEPSISDQKVQLNAPANQYQSTSYNLNFWWNEVDEAIRYRLQIVTPNFDTIGSLVVDTLVKSNKFSLTLSPGQYQWRVRAENGSSQTTYSNPQGFTVLFSSIKEQKVQLGAPVNNFSTNQSAITFNWNSLYGATKYRLQIDTSNFIDESKVIYDKVTPGLQLNYTLAKDHVYQWRIRAENDTAQAKWSSINSFTYDHTPPPVVNLSSPANNQSINLPVSLQWNPSSTATRYKLYVLKSDSTTLYNNTFPMQTNSTGYNFNQGITGERIYWKVVAVDAVGNESTASTMRSFVLQ